MRNAANILPSRLREGTEGWACGATGTALLVQAHPLTPSREREGGR
jgi:hypothetical protein